jgi:hypothetical protein
LFLGLHELVEYGEGILDRRGQDAPGVGDAGGQARAR